LAVLLSAFSSLIVGAFLVVTPWTRWWDANYLLQPSPWLRDLVLNAYTRGTVSGLGLLNILLALSDLRDSLRRGGRGR
jgi:hypothetical protein